jgi:hypothetical protein
MLLRRDPLRWISLYPPFLKMIHIFDASIKDDQTLEHHPFKWDQLRG